MINYSLTSDFYGLLHNVQRQLKGWITATDTANRFKFILSSQF